MPRHSPNRTRIDDAIAYLTQHYQEKTIFTRSKLVKLLYLADKHHKQTHAWTITGVAWTKYHYGPYADIIVDRIEALDNNRIHVDVYRQQSGAQYHHRPCSHTDDATESLTDDMINSLDAVLDEHAHRDTTAIVKDILDTEPVADTPKYGIIQLNDTTPQSTS